MWFFLEGDIYPYVRTTQRQKWLDEHYQYYAASNMRIAQQLRQQMYDRERPMFGSTPLAMGLVIQTTKALHKRDLSNILKAVEDAAQRIVFQNDAWIDMTYARRVQGKRDVAGLLIESMDSTLHMQSFIARVHQVARELDIMV